jgi:hypothetical protein
MLYPDATIQSQYAASPTITALVEGFNAQIDPRSEVQTFYDRIFNPRTAEGVGLDIWARIVGVERNIYVEDLSENFGFFITGGSPVPDTYTVPSAVQALPGYGWSAGSVCNEVDWLNKKYIQRVMQATLTGTSNTVFSNLSLVTQGSLKYLSFRANDYPHLAEGNNKTYNSLSSQFEQVKFDFFGYGSLAKTAYAVQGNWNIGFALYIDGYTTLEQYTSYLNSTPLEISWELATPIETDISAYISSMPSLSVEPNSTLTFANSNGDDYHIPVPSTITYTAGGESVTDDTVAYAKPIGAVQGNVSVESIGGKTLVWSQLVSNGDFSDGATGWTANSANGTFAASEGVGTLTCTVGGARAGCRVSTGTYNGIALHKLYVKIEYKSSALRDIYFGDGVGTAFFNVAEARIKVTPEAVNTWYIADGITTRQSVDASGNTAFKVFFSYADVGETLQLRNLMCIDLTAMYGEGNEPTAEEFRASFPGDYYAHDTGSLLSAGVTAVEYYRPSSLSQEWQPWDQGVFYEPGNVRRGSYRIDDNAFRKFIFWKALANISTADAYTLNRLLSKLFDNPVIVTETGVMQIRMTTTKPLADWQKAVLVQYGLFGKPAGVGYEFWTIVTPVLGFVRDGENYMPLGQTPFFSGVMNSDFGGN